MTGVQTCALPILPGKNRRRGNVEGKTAKKKKAIVQLTEDSEDIEIFGSL